MPGNPGGIVAAIRGVEDVQRRAAPDRDSFRAITSQTATAMLWTGVAMLLGFALKVVMTRKMLPRDMGIVLTAQASVGLAAIVATLGIPEAVVRLLGIEATSGTAPKGIVTSSLTLVAGATAGAAAIMLAVLASGYIVAGDALWAAIILTLAVPVLGLGEVLGAAYRGVGRLGTKILFGDVTRGLIVLAALLASPAVWAGDAPYVAGLFTAAAAGSLIALWIYFRGDARWRKGGAVSPAELLRFGIPLTGAVLLAGPIFLNVLPMLLSAWTGPAAVAFYTVAVSAYNFVYLPVGILEQAAVPAWARLAAHGDTDDLTRSFHRYTDMCFAGAAGLGLAIMANDRSILTFVFGPAFAIATAEVRIVILATFCIALVGPNEGLLHALGLSRSIFQARLAGAIAGVAAAVLLIPGYGLLGAIGAFAIGSVSMNGLYGVMLYRSVGIHPFTAAHLRTIGLTAAGVLAVTVVADSYMFAGRVLATALAVAILVAHADLRLAARQILKP